jgi:hypothetical protein
LVYFFPIWYNLWLLPRFGVLYQEKSGKPVTDFSLGPFLKKIYVCIFLDIAMVAQIFLGKKCQQTLPKGHKIPTYIKRLQNIPNDHKIYQHFPLHAPKYTYINGNFWYENIHCPKCN